MQNKVQRKRDIFAFYRCKNAAVANENQLQSRNDCIDAVIAQTLLKQRAILSLWLSR
jgi:hypothetical protein